MEGVAVSVGPSAWRGRRVLVTGHTGFKGSWLCLWLERLGAVVTGYALPPPTTPSLFTAADVGRSMTSIIGDVRDLDALRTVVTDCAPEVVFHLAAQALVRESYASPVETYATNVMGTVHVLEAIRGCRTVKAAVVVTSDKCYANVGRREGYRESDPMGGHDPYSSSKGCAELVVAAYRQSYFRPDRLQSHGVALATARAGNVIGGGDWARDRLVPDCIAAFVAGEVVRIRYPDAVRPWQHVLEPLCGYLRLAERLLDGQVAFADAWNFGPSAEHVRPVRWIVEHLAELFGKPVRIEMGAGDNLEEAAYLALDNTRTREHLGPLPALSLERTLADTMAWYSAYHAGEDVRLTTLRQIDAFQGMGVPSPF